MTEDDTKFDYERLRELAQKAENEELTVEELHEVKKLVESFFDQFGDLVQPYI